MNLLRDSDDEDIVFNPAPAIPHVESPAINTVSTATASVQEVSITDAIWQEIHYKKKEKKKRNKRREKRRVEFPWEAEERIRNEASISERMSFKQRMARRTWFPSVGHTELPDTVIWHNTINVKDHLGRSWVCPPISYVPNPDHECFLPKSRLHKFSFHTSSVTNVEMFPGSGHLILSSSLDTTLRIWSLFGDRQCIQTYIGHTNGVRDCAFNHDGSKFASICYGKHMKLWDTEKGAIDGAVLDAVPSKLLFNPTNDQDVVVTLADNRTVQYDLRVGNTQGRRPVCEYKFHPAPVSCGVFMNGGRFFVTSGEDASLALWEVGTPRPVAVMKEQWMKPVSALAVHPKKPFILGQMQNEIAVFRAETGFRVHQKRSFVGHQTESFACGITMSPDGTYVASGDATGSLFIWDWKTATIRKTFELHDQVLIGAAWSPHSPSQIATCSWDNTLCLLD